MLSEQIPGARREAVQRDDRHDMARAALESANLNAVRMALLQLTGDEELERVSVSTQPVRGGASFAFVVRDPDDKELVRTKALAYLSEERSEAQSTLARSEIERLIRVSVGDHLLADDDVRLLTEELAVEEFPRGVTAPSSNDVRQGMSEFQVLVIGAGIGGIATGIQLKRAGFPFVILERQSGIGGTWQLNDYPGARVDTASYLYQFTFEKRYPWKEYFASRELTLEYLNHIVDKHGLNDHIQLGVEIEAATWDENTAMWQVEVRNQSGTTSTLSAHAIISASGLFSKPNVPDIPGIGDYEGPIFHTTAWKHDVDLTGKRVALIGTGSTGSQLTAAIADSVDELTVYQRNPQWVAPNPIYRDKVAPEVHWLTDNLPYYWNWYRYFHAVSSLQSEPAQEYDREWMRDHASYSERNEGVRAALVKYIETAVGGDPDLVEKCVPDFPPMVRRLVVDNGWYEALRKDTVHLVTTPIDRFHSRGIVTADGQSSDFDVVILAAGFEVSQYLWPVRYAGRDGVNPEKEWAADGARSYLGMTMPGLPNFFMLYGPNGQPRNTSYYSWTEAWARYIIKALIGLIEVGGRSIEVRRDVFDDYNHRLDVENEKLVWDAPGHSYYINEHGRSGINLPWRSGQYHEWIRKPDLGDFNIT
jgi:4-hydroxyacetophenone monooxygenase